MTDTLERPRLKITYATLRNDNDELHAQFEAGLEQARATAGPDHRNFVGGQERDGEGTFEKRSPIDGSLVGTFAKGTRSDVQDAIAAARAAFPAWSRRPWQERVAILRRVADVISERQMDLRRVCSPSRSARTGSRRSATSRRRPTSSAGRATWSSRTTASTTPWATSATRGPHPLGAQAVRRVGRSSAPSTSRSRCRAARRAARSWPATRSSTSRRPTRRCRASA